MTAQPKIIRAGFDVQAARKDFSQSVQITPTPMTWYMLGVILEQQKNIPAATQAYEKALQMNPNLRDAQSRLSALEHQTRP